MRQNTLCQERAISRMGTLPYYISLKNVKPKVKGSNNALLFVLFIADRLFFITFCY